MRLTCYLRKTTTTCLSMNTSKPVAIGLAVNAHTYLPFLLPPTIRTKRFQEMKRIHLGCFGSVEEISRIDFVREVTEASKTHPVLVYLYQTR